MFQTNITTSDYMTLIVTNRCNRQCPFCVDTQSHSQKPEYMSLETVQKAIKFAKANHIQDILLVGGEATLHPAISAIAHACHSANLRVILTTNFDDLDIIYALDEHIDCFNFSYYGQAELPDPSRFKHADVTLSTLIYQGQLDTKTQLDKFIEKHSNAYHLKFSTLTPCNHFCATRQHVPYLDELDCEWFVLFNEILGQRYRNTVIKRYDRVINKMAKQSYKCSVTGEITTHW